MGYTANGDIKEPLTSLQTGLNNIVMKTIIYIIIVMSLLGCKLLQKNKYTQKTETESETMQLVEQRNTLNRKSEVFLVDSSDNHFTLQLWPRGKFTFSVAKGFEGEAEKIIIKSKQTSQKLFTTKEESQLDSTRVEARYSQTKETSTLVKKNTLRFGYNWAWLLLIPGIYIVYFFYKHYRSSKRALTLI